MKRTTYPQLAEQLLQLFAIAKETLENADDVSNHEKSSMHSYIDMNIELVRNPKPQFHKVASLRILGSEFLTYWNEAEGQHIDAFWAAVSTSDLPFARKNVFAVVLKRGKITDTHEYNQITDGIVVMAQEGQLTLKKQELLNEMLAEFEKRG